MIERDRFVEKKPNRFLPFRERFLEPKKPEITIEQCFLSEPVAKNARRDALDQIPKAHTIEQHGTFIENPDDIPYRPSTTVSPTDTSDKFTHDVDACITLVTAGNSDEGNISKLFHIAPKLLIDKQSSFTTELDEFKSHLNGDKPSTIIAGGLFIAKKVRSNTTFKQDYEEMIKKVSKEVSKVLDVETLVVPPKRKIITI